MSNWIIVPCVCGPQMSKRAIDSALRQDIGDVRVLAVCNGSTDGTPQSLQARYWNEARFEIISYPDARSLHKLWNDAIGMTLAHQPHVLVINNDVELRTDLYRLLVSDGGHFVSGVSVGDPREMHSANATLHSPHPDFSCFLITRECWQRVGQFDARYWAYCGDLDYHLRMHHAGIEASALAIPFYHARSSTMRMMTNEERDELQQRADRDRELFKERYGFEAGSEAYNAQFKTVPA